MRLWRCFMGTELLLQTAKKHLHSQLHRVDEIAMQRNIKCNESWQGKASCQGMAVSCWCRWRVSPAQSCLAAHRYPAQTLPRFMQWHIQGRFKAWNWVRSECARSTREMHRKLRGNRKKNHKGKRERSLFFEGNVQTKAITTSIGMLSISLKHTFHSFIWIVFGWLPTTDNVSGCFKMNF